MDKSNENHLSHYTRGQRTIIIERHFPPEGPAAAELMARCLTEQLTPGLPRPEHTALDRFRIPDKGG